MPDVGRYFPILKGLTGVVTPLRETLVDPKQYSDIIHCVGEHISRQIDANSVCPGYRWLLGVERLGLQILVLLSFHKIPFWFRTCIPGCANHLNYMDLGAII